MDRNDSTGHGSRTGSPERAAKLPRKAVFTKSHRNRNKNPACAQRRTQTKIRMLLRAGIPLPGPFFLGLIGAATPVFDALDVPRGASFVCTTATSTDAFAGALNVSAPAPDVAMDGPLNVSAPAPDESVSAMFVALNDGRRAIERALNVSAPARDDSAGFVALDERPRRTGVGRSSGVTTPGRPNQSIGDGRSLAAARVCIGSGISCEDKVTGAEPAADRRADGDNG